MSVQKRVPEYKQRRYLAFSNDWIESLVVSGAHKLTVDDAIIVNLSPRVLRYSVANDRGVIRPWKSAMLRECTVEDADTVTSLRVRRRMNIGGVALGWQWYGERNSQFPRETPLFISPQDEIADVEIDPELVFSLESSGSASPRRYRIKLNLWYTPEETDCGIHNEHGFLETHTQIVGTGHMQKFRENDADTLYEDVLMPPGFTHDAFFVLRNDGSFAYPWHRYYAETDCIWMAIELHPV